MRVFQFCCPQTVCCFKLHQNMFLWFYLLSPNRVLFQASSKPFSLVLLALCANPAGECKFCALKMLAPIWQRCPPFLVTSSAFCFLNFCEARSMLNLCRPWASTTSSALRTLSMRSTQLGQPSSRHPTSCGPSSCLLPRCNFSLKPSAQPAALIPALACSCVHHASLLRLPCTILCCGHTRRAQALLAYSL